MTEILNATNCNRTYIAKGISLASNFYSNIADFQDMPMGSIQIVWKDVTGIFNGTIKLHASILHEEDAFFDGGEIEGAVFDIDVAAGNCIWIRDRLAFRYLQARYLKNGITGGTIDIIAYGKKS